MYFSENPSLNICRQRKSELENWISTLKTPLHQHIKSGNVPESPTDEAEAIVSFEAEILRYLSDNVLVQFAFHAPWVVDIGYKAIFIKSVENGDSE
jgi:hypothetical protein